MKWILAYLFMVNVYTYYCFAADKRKARNNQWRIPEKRLLMLALAGGALGAWRGMKDFHHKVNKITFIVFVPLFFVLQIALIGYIMVYRIGFNREDGLILILGAALHALLFFILQRINKHGYR